jgi:carbon storage regulator
MIIWVGREMLVLTRTVGERIHVGDDVWVQVLDVRGSVVRLGVEAPRRIEVHRGEIFLRIQAQRRQASAVLASP